MEMFNLDIFYSYQCIHDNIVYKNKNKKIRDTRIIIIVYLRNFLNYFGKLFILRNCYYPQNFLHFSLKTVFFVIFARKHPVFF